MFYHKRVFYAQNENPSKGVFIQLVKEDFKIIGEQIDFENICKMTQIQFKNHIKKQIKMATFKSLQNVQKGHSKVNEIQYKKLEIQEYLKSPKFSNTECELLFALRSHTKRGIKGNFPSFYFNDISCPLKCNETNPEDCQSHLLNCERILARLKNNETDTVQYSDIYGCLTKQKAVVRLYLKLFKIREELLRIDISVDAPTSGESLDTAPPAGQGSGGDP